MIPYTNAKFEIILIRIYYYYYYNLENENSMIDLEIGSSRGNRFLYFNFPDQGERIIFIKKKNAFRRNNEILYFVMIRIVSYRQSVKLYNQWHREEEKRNFNIIYLSLRAT